MPGRITLLTGGAGVGKTTVCKQLVAMATERGYRCAGLLSEALVEGGRCVGASVIDLSTGRQRELARIDRKLGPLNVGRWSFNPSGLEWGDALLRGLGACDLLAVDEIGVLELERGLGWRDAWGVLERRQFAMAVVIARPRLVEQVRNLVAAHEVLTVTRATRDELPRQMIKTLDALVAQMRTGVG